MESERLFNWRIAHRTCVLRLGGRGRLNKRPLESMGYDLRANVSMAIMNRFARHEQA